MNPKQKEALLGRIWARVAPSWAHDVRGSLNTAAIHLELIQATVEPGTPAAREIENGAREIRTAIAAVTSALESMERVAGAARDERAREQGRGGFAEEWDAALGLAAIFARKRGTPLAITGDPITGPLTARDGAGSPTIPLLHILFGIIESAGTGTGITVAGKDEPGRCTLTCAWQVTDDTRAGDSLEGDSREGAPLETGPVAASFAASGWDVRHESRDSERRIVIVLTKGEVA